MFSNTLMHAIVNQLAIVLPVVAVIGVLLVVLINIYLNIRRLIPVKVNCWFCNQWTKVHYDVRNCFECPSCLQYNGFNSDGDYNKPLAAQYDDLLNPDVTYNKLRNKKSAAATNGLCFSCNNNLRLKVFQLANFVPLNKTNFDIEIEHFEQQLDKAYQLCSQCEIAVKSILRKQNETLGIKLPILQKKGIRLLDFNNYSGRKRIILLKVIGTVLVLIAFGNIAYILTSLDYSNNSLKNTLPVSLHSYALKVKESLTNIREYVADFLEDTFRNDKMYFQLPSQTATEYEYNAKLLCCIGLMLQFCLILLSEGGHIRKLIQVISWGLLIWFSWNLPAVNLNYNNYAQILTNIVIIGSICIKWSSKVKSRKIKRKAIHKIKSPKATSKDQRIYDVNNTKKVSLKKEAQEHFTEFKKPNFAITNKLSNTAYLNSFQNNRTTLCNYSTDSVSIKSSNLQDELVTDLDKLKLGRPCKSKSNDYINPFLKIQSPIHVRNRSYQIWGRKSYENDNAFVMPSSPSSFVLKVQFSTRNSKY